MADVIPKTDGELLAEYARTASDVPFEGLVRRHGPLVYGTCLRVLHRREDAEDAAQAVFLVLARKAGSLTQSGSVAGWLHQVAWHVARRHQTAARLRTRHERHARAESCDLRQDADAVRAVLDDALTALPEKYRQPIIHCHLEGRSVEEGAVAAGCTPVTLTQRLCRGRAMLRDRLARMGVTVSTATLALVLSKSAWATDLPGSFVASTVGAAGGAAVPVQVSGLAKGAAKAMFYAKLKSVAAVMAVAMIGAGAGLAGYRATAEEPQSTVSQAPATSRLKGLSPAEVDQLLPLIRLSPGEDPFSDIAWFTDVEAAQRKAATEGKPLFVFSNGGEPLGGT